MTGRTLSFTLLTLFAFAFAACSTLSPPRSAIVWPDTIIHMKAIGEIDISRKDLYYSGDMSLSLHYPETLLLEVYGPFGDTIVSLKKDHGRFVMKTGKNVIKDEERIARVFGMTVTDLMDDLTMRGEMLQDNGRGLPYIQRKQYRVLYNVKNHPKPSMCWLNTDGTICINFNEASFGDN